MPFALWLPSQKGWFSDSPHRHNTLVTRKVDEWHRHLEEKGITIEQPPTHNPRYNIYHLFLRDPNGYLIEIQRFNHPFP